MFRYQQNEEKTSQREQNSLSKALFSYFGTKVTNQNCMH
jgi:hypothetical protein